MAGGEPTTTGSDALGDSRCRVDRGDFIMEIKGWTMGYARTFVTKSVIKDRHPQGFVAMIDDCAISCEATRPVWRSKIAGPTQYSREE